MASNNKKSTANSTDKKWPLLNGDEKIAGKDKTKATDTNVQMEEKSSETQPCLEQNHKDTESKPDGDGEATGAGNGDVGDPHKEKLIGDQEASTPTKKGGTLSQRRKELEEGLRARTGLSRHGLLIAAGIVFLLLVLAVVVMALALAWPRLPHKMQYPVCSTPQCLSASAQMLPRMNFSVDSCSDFWSFSCGGWLSSTEMPPPVSRWGLAERQRAWGDEKVRKLIATLSHPTNFNSVTSKLKYFYESCMALDNVEADKDRPLLKLIAELGGWHVRREFSVLSWDYRHVLTLLHSKYGVEPFFSISVVTDVRRPQQTIIKISPSGLGLPDRSYYYRPINSPAVLAYKRYLKDVAQLLGALNTAASTFSDDMFYFEKRIAEITPENSSLNADPISTYHRMTLNELKMSAPSIPLHDILLAKFPLANFEDMAVLVPSPLYLSDISSLIATTDRGALNNYVMWRLASAYMPYLSQQFRDILSLYQKEMAGVKESFDRWEMCADTLQRFMGFAVAALTQRTDDNTDNIRAVINNIFEEIRATVQKKIEDSWFQNELRKHVLEKLSGLSLQVGLPPHLLEDRHLDSMYSRLHVQKNDFFQNIRYGISYIQEEQERMLNTPTDEHRWVDVLTGQTVEYVPTANKVVVPMSVLSEPFFDPSFPLPVLYGGIGVEIARAIVSAILPWNNLYAAKGDLLDAWSPVVNQSAKANRHAVSCLSQFVKSQNLTQLPSTVNRTVIDTLHRVVAVRQGYQTMLRLEKTRPHVHQPAMEEYEPAALFFITYAQSLCSLHTKEQADIDETTSPSLASKSLLKTTVAQLTEFSDVWGCRGELSPQQGHESCIDVL